jgi:phage minor structural protein
MMPVLFAPKTREYNNNGLGVLSDSVYCTVTEERNGSFELELQYPVNGIHYAYLAVDYQILAKPNETSDPQAFRIYNISKPLNGVVTVRAEHISYELSSVIVSPFSSDTVIDAMNKIKSKSITENIFDFWTDKETVANMSQTLPTSARSLLGGVKGSILDVYGGEYEFDNYTVKLHQNRGDDNGVVISYAKNLTGVKCEERIDGIVTGAIAYWAGETAGIAQSIYGDLQTIETSLSYSRNVIVDCSSEFTDQPSKDTLNEYATKYIQEHKNVPYFSVAVEFVNLGDTEEYKQYKGLYRVNLCDTVTVRHPLYGIDVQAKVVKTVFDSLREKYEKIEIGEVYGNISRTIATQGKEIAQKVGFSELDKAVANATSSIAGNKGGYVVLFPSAVKPQELLILDKPDISEANNVWRWNLGGLGHSNTGYGGNFTTAITSDGRIVADFITTGTLDANKLTVKNLNANSIVSGSLTSTNGYSTFNLNTGNARFGGKNYYTEISGGALIQYLGSSGGSVGGMVPTGSTGKISQTIFYDNRNANCEGVLIAAQAQGGGFIDVASFSVENVSINSDFVCLGGSNFYFEEYKVYINGNALVGGYLRANGVVNNSDRKIKKNIKSTLFQNAENTVRNLKMYDYDLIDTGNSIKMGLMADEAPDEILAEDKKGVNLYSYCGLLAMAIQEISRKLEQIEKRGHKNAGNAKQKT